MGAVSGWTLVWHIWSPPDVNASVDFPGNDPWWSRHFRGSRLDKQALRADLRAQRRAHVAGLPEAMRGLVFRRPPAPALDLLPEGAMIGLYDAGPMEAPTTAYAGWLFENGRSLALPWFAGRDADMRFRRWDNPFVDDLLEPGPYGAWQPGEDAAEVVPDVLIVPLIGFTATGARLGQGGGHYDRWLGEHPEVLAIGLAWDCQEVIALPLEPHDRMLTAVITPTRLLGPL
jgi:5-formyltetrahydrofolate cyclo-ligase